MKAITKAITKALRDPQVQVWQCYDHREELTGFVLTEWNDRSRLIAFVPGGPAGDRDKEEALAMSAAADLSIINHSNDIFDLRDYCTLDSPLPTPVEFFGYRVCPLKASTNWLVPLVPFCRFRLAKLMDSFCRQAFTAEELDECYPNPPMIQLCDGDSIEPRDGTNFRLVRIAPADSPL